MSVTSPQERRRLSRYLSWILRHAPDAIGVEVEAGGWVRLDRLIQASADYGTVLSESVIRDVVEHNDKQRFAFSKDGLRIRAQHGHSIPIDLELTPSHPPEILYHGTIARALASIRSDGIASRTRRYVHLSADRETARIVGARRGEPVILDVRAAAMESAGHQFYQTSNGVWLTERVPAEFVEAPPGASKSGST